MIAVYVETNFVLELALEQEEADSCGKILDLAVHARISLLVPAFSLAEPHGAISGRAKARSRLGNELRPQLRELGRSKPLQHVPGAFDALAKVLVESEQWEREGVRKTVMELLDSADIIPLTGSILADAASLQDRFGIASGQDSIVLASVLMDLKSRKPESGCFMNRNFRDFDDPDIRGELAALNCKFFGRFDDGLDYVTHQLAM